MYNTLKHLLFYFDPEVAHDMAEVALRFSGNYFEYPLEKLSESAVVHDDRLKQTILGINFPNPVGLAAGFDKNATMTKALRHFGFGAIEVGTITPKAQEGNAKPRLFRHIEEESLQNAFGFNNDGLLKIAKRVKSIYPFEIPIGINIGKNKATGAEKTLGDYETLLKEFRSTGDYIVINISSPNTPGLRDLQNENFIKALFEMAKAITMQPIFLKIAPDMHASDAIDLSTMAIESGAKGIIATNTTVDYSVVKEPLEKGGISGQALKEKSAELFAQMAKELYGKTTLISVGGIDSAEEAYERIKNGASLVQVYTAFIYKGPMLCADINRGLIELMKRDGFEQIGDAVGANLR
jgi:dihydroorotate dehydrogenase